MEIALFCDVSENIQIPDFFWQHSQNMAMFIDEDKHMKTLQILVELIKF